MPDLLVIALLVIGPVGIWFLMRFLNKPSPDAPGGMPPAPPEA